MDLKSTVDLQTHNGSGVARARYKEKRLNDEEDERVGSKDRLKEGEGEKRETIQNTMCFPRPRSEIQHTGVSDSAHFPPAFPVSVSMAWP